MSLLFNAILSAASKYFSGFLAFSPGLLQAIDSVVSLGLITVLFALIFKVLPEAKVRWRDVWVGALLTSVLFTLGKFLIGLYLGTSSVASAFGASASVVLILVWTYYSALILFYGAEFTKIYAKHHGPRRAEQATEPAPQGVRINFPKRDPFSSSTARG